MRFNSVLPIAAAAVGITMTTAVNPASAFTIGFSNITTNNGTNTTTVGGQLSAEITQPVNTVPTANIVFKNVGSVASVIAQIYFSGTNALGTLANIGNTTTPLVNFSPSGVSPADLPGATQAFKDNQFLALGATNPAPKNGVKLGETFLLQFALPTGANAFSNLETALKNGNLKIGLHVISIAGGGSDSYVSSVTPNPVPEPFTIVGSGVALGVGAMMRKKQQKKEKSIG